MTTSLLPAALARCRRALLAVGLFSLIVNLLMLTVSLYMMQVFDRVLASRSTATLLWLTVVAVGAVALLGLLDALRTRVLARTGVWLEQRLGCHVLSRAVTAALGQHDYRTEALRDLGTLRAFLGSTTALSLFDAPWVPVYLAFAYLLHPLIGHIALAGALALLALALLNDRLTAPALGRANAAVVRAMRRAEACVRNPGAIDAMGLLPGIAGVGPRTRPRRWPSTRAPATARPWFWACRGSAGCWCRSRCSVPAPGWWSATTCPAAA